MKLYAEQDGERVELEATPKNIREAGELAAQIALDLKTYTGTPATVKVFDGEALVYQVRAA